MAKKTAHPMSYPMPAGPKPSALKPSSITGGTQRQTPGPKPTFKKLGKRGA